MSRMSSKNKRLNVTVSPAIYDEVYRVCEYSGMSMSSFIAMCIMNHFKEEQALQSMSNIKDIEQLGAMLEKKFKP
jgi:lauroyl/myristoyl acyltransferase